MNRHQPPVRLAIVNDYAVVVAGVATLLSEHVERVSVIELANRTWARSHVDIVLVDTFSLVRRGLYALPKLIQEARDEGVKVVMFSWDTSEQPVQEAMSQGAAGYLWKGLEPDELVDALEVIQTGQVVTLLRGLDPGIDSPDDVDARGDWPGHDFALSPREAEVVSLIAKGLTNQEIAGTLYLGMNTVKTYIRTAYQKMGVARRSQAVVWALEHGYALESRRRVRDTDRIEAPSVGYRADMNLEPIPETVEAVEEFGPFASGDDDLLTQLHRRAAQVVALVPHCMGLSLASIEEKVTFTLVATSTGVASLDAMQYLSGGPCVEAVKAEQVLAYDSDQLFDEDGWRQFAAATAAAGVKSTLSLPILRDSQVIGTINLYASTSDAFDGHHEDVAAVFGAWAPGAVTNADLSFATRDTAQMAPQKLRDDIDIQVATSMVAEHEAVDLDTSRARLDDAAQRAGIGIAHLARTVIRVGRLPDNASP